ncbi:hypothetical protein RND71_040856 [Anisodus tanguticus]|uniref:Cytochrome b561 domain-containing protein n=1 Tax=Anisodus tanguticus TaxID=243964 RepID=A0AAE1QUC4_9SOLA|nr:hypothetical protein RND71_040856 [Anisodus tanguticus]
MSYLIQFKSSQSSSSFVTDKKSKDQRLDFSMINNMLGVILGLTGVAVGIQLNNKLQPHIPGHQGIGILIFVLSILQVLAFFVRTDKDSKYRKYWNLYHSWMGIALFFGAVNIVSGMHYEGAGQGWKIGYGFVLGSTMLACIILETLLRLKKLDEPTLCLSERLDT